MSWDVRACVFDAYGTLFDFNAAVARCRDQIGERAEAVSALWRQKQLEYSWLRSLMQRHTTFWQVTSEALDYALASHGLADPALRERLLKLYWALDPYPEAGAMLAQLQEAGLRTAILSNGSPDMLGGAVRSSGFGDRLDAVLSVEEVGVFKPDPRVYQLAVDRLDLPAEQIAFFSSNGWDIAGATAFGLRTVWVNRAGAPWERLGVAPAAELRDLAGAASLILG